MLYYGYNVKICLAVPAHPAGSLFPVSLLPFNQLETARVLNR